MDESQEWPSEITEHFRRFVLEARSPAFLVTDAEGRLVAHGGDLEKYGLKDLLEGERAADRAYFLEGLLPSNGNRTALSRVEISAGTFADVHLFPLGKRDCALLLDVTAEVTERAQIEQALRVAEASLRHAEKMEALGRLAGGVAHDFNNLLTVILGYGQMLSDIAPSSDFGQAAHQVVIAAEKAAAVTRQLLSFSRRQVQHTEVIDLNGVISGVQQLLQRLIGEDVALTATLDPGLKSVQADRSQMEQILVNVAANARDAMPSGGKLEIRTVNVQLDEDFLRRHPAIKLHYGPYVNMMVTDTGCGMDSETCARIFEPFFTSKPAGRGTGLGLSIVYGIITQAGGDVIVTSAVGQGTRIEILLPAAQKAATAARVEKASSPPMGNETILVVEDEDEVRNLIRTILTELGYTVLTCSEPFAAMQVARRHRERIDLLLTDVVLPNMDGARLAESITKTRPNIAVLYVSGYAAESVSQRRISLPGGTFLQKPFTRTVLAAKVREALIAGIPPGHQLGREVVL